MAKKSFSLIDAEGRHLYACCWTPSSDPIAGIAIVHGLSDHLDRYEYVSGFFNKNKIVVLGMDYQGHGKSPGKRGHISSFNLLMSNVENLLIEARFRYNDLPLFLYGHSLGGNIVANYILKHRSKELSGAIIASPYFKLAFTPPKWKTNLARVLGRILPFLTLSDGLDPMELSHDPLIGKAYLEDPLVHSKISVKTYNIASRQGSWALEHASLLNYPTLIMHGDEDRLTSYTATQKFADNAGSIATMKIWKGLRHELHNETNKEEVLSFICNWIIHVIEKSHDEN